MLQDKYLFLAQMMQTLNKCKQTCPQFLLQAQWNAKVKAVCIWIVSDTDMWQMPRGVIVCKLILMCSLQLENWTIYMWYTSKFSLSNSYCKPVANSAYFLKFKVRRNQEMLTKSVTF